MRVIPKHGVMGQDRGRGGGGRRRGVSAPEVASSAALPWSSLLEGCPELRAMDSSEEAAAGKNRSSLWPECLWQMSEQFRHIIGLREARLTILMRKIYKRQSSASAYSVHLVGRRDGASSRLRTTTERWRTELKRSPLCKSFHCSRLLHEGRNSCQGTGVGICFS